jgi:heptose I phosphotransferase
VIYRRDDVQALFRDERTVADFMRIDGEVIKHAVRTRRTSRIQRGGRLFYMKTHWGVGWWEIIKNILSFRLPVLSARNEYRAITVVQKLGLDTMQVAAFGEAGINPASLKSFLITDAIEHTEDLEHWLPDLVRAQSAPAAIRLKRAVIRKVATIAGKMHQHGVNHRDLYLCHLRLDVSDGDRPDPGRLRIYVMDLHRAQVRGAAPRRWIVKDIAALLFSSLCAARLTLSRNDCLRFVAAYSGVPWRRAVETRRRFWRQVVRRATRMCRKSGGPMPHFKF